MNITILLSLLFISSTLPLASSSSSYRFRVSYLLPCLSSIIITRFPPPFPYFVFHLLLHSSSLTYFSPFLSHFLFSSCFYFFINMATTQFCVLRAKGIQAHRSHVGHCPLSHV
jgi:hypothetical protein